jgi:hypothetical protein
LWPHLWRCCRRLQTGWGRRAWWCPGATNAASAPPRRQHQRSWTGGAQGGADQLLGGGRL